MIREAKKIAVPEDWTDAADSPVRLQNEAQNNHLNIGSSPLPCL